MGCIQRWIIEETDGTHQKNHCSQTYERLYVITVRIWYLWESHNMRLRTRENPSGGFIHTISFMPDSDLQSIQSFAQHWRRHTGVSQGSVVKKSCDVQIWCMFHAWISDSLRRKWNPISVFVWNPYLMVKSLVVLVHRVSKSGHDITEHTHSHYFFLLCILSD